MDKDGSENKIKQKWEIVLHSLIMSGILWVSNLKEVTTMKQVEINSKQIIATAAVTAKLQALLLWCWTLTINVESYLRYEMGLDLTSTPFQWGAFLFAKQGLRIRKGDSHD